MQESAETPEEVGAYQRSLLSGACQDIDCATDKLRAAQDGGAAVKWLEERVVEALQLRGKLQERCKELPEADVKRFGDDE